MSLHFVKLYPGSKEEKQFIELLNGVDVKLESVMCRHGSIFETKYDEYILSDGLYKLIRDGLTDLKKAW